MSAGITEKAPAASWRIGVIGATGLVGRTCLELLARGDCGSPRVRAYAKEGGQDVQFNSAVLRVEPAASLDFEDLDLVFLCVEAGVARAYATRARRAGVVCIDHSSAFRMDPSVPLVVPGVNDAALSERPPLIANPNCTTIINTLIAAPLHREFGLERMVCSSYQAASGAGAEYLERMLDDTRRDLDGEGNQLANDSLAFNVVPQIGAVIDHSSTDEELKLQRETVKILGLPSLEVAATCVRVPTRVSHGVSTTAWFERDIDADAARRVLASAPGVVLDDMPTARACAGSDDVHVGRLRQSPFGERVLSWFVVGDQLRVGAALNAVRIASTMLGTKRVRMR